MNAKKYHATNARDAVFILALRACVTLDGFQQSTCRIQHPKNELKIKLKYGNGHVIFILILDAVQKDESLRAEGRHDSPSRPIRIFR